MVKLDNLYIKTEDSQGPINPRKICRIIRDNLLISPYIAKLGADLGIDKNADKKDLKTAVKRLRSRTPYYTLVEYNRSTGERMEIMRFLRLVETSYRHIFKIEVETDIKHLLESMINDSVNRGIIIKRTRFVSLTINGELRKLGNEPFPNELESLNASTILDCYQTLEYKFLTNLHSSSNIIVPVLENICNTENKELGLIFTIGESREYAIIVYENYLSSRATYLFVIKTELYELAVNKIKSFFQSNINNKRSNFKVLSKSFISKKMVLLRS